MDAYKREIADLRSKLDLEANRADKLEFETKNLMEKVEGLSNEKDRLLNERDKLKESHDELQDRLAAGDNGPARPTDQGQYFHHLAIEARVNFEKLLLQIKESKYIRWFEEEIHFQASQG